ncbi:MAG: hypothetical protein MTP17_04350 [Candidatus Midichloria sp.]|nr:MAG: hypothetical protein MTP17_04350 [Candidatus Midichloria sp.]
MAKHVANCLNTTCKYDILARIKDAPKQILLSQKMRYSNIRGVFLVNEKKVSSVKSLNILLVDEVMTTGTTIRECAEILKKAKTKSVSAINYC